mgnify:CR=1 FL=1
MKRNKYIIDRDPFVEAGKSNLMAVLPKRNELQIDLDSEQAYQQFLRAFSVMSRYRKMEIVSLQFSKSGAPNRHVYIKTGRVSDSSRVALQSMLGSDVVRENLSMQRIKCNHKNPTVFFENVGFVRKVDPGCAGENGMRFVCECIGKAC